LHCTHRPPRWWCCQPHTRPRSERTKTLSQSGPRALCCVRRVWPCRPCCCIPFSNECIVPYHSPTHTHKQPRTCVAEPCYCSWTAGGLAGRAAPGTPNPVSPAPPPGAAAHTQQHAHTPLSTSRACAWAALQPVRLSGAVARGRCATQHHAHTRLGTTL